MSSITPSGKLSVVAPLMRRGTMDVLDECRGALGQQSHGLQYQCRRALIVVIAFVLASVF